MYRHLVAIEIGIERSAHQRMKLDRFAFDQYWLERLNAQTVQGRRTVQHHGVFADDFFKNIPCFGQLFFHQLLRHFDGGRHAFELKF